MSKYTTVIWDLDGTLLYTLTDLMNAVNSALKKYGYPEHDLEFIRKAVGNGVKKLMELSIPDGLSNPDYDRAYEAFNLFYKEHDLDNTKPYDGIASTVEKLREYGVKQAIVSNKIDYAVKRLNDTFFRMECAIGTQDGLRRKPDADMVLKAMEELGADRERTVYVGDSEVDIATAKNAGLPCISVLWGFRSKEELMPYKPQLLAEDTDELLKLVLGE